MTKQDENRCKAIAKKTNERCRNVTEEGNDYCHLHKEDNGEDAHVLRHSLTLKEQDIVLSALDYIKHEVLLHSSEFLESELVNRTARKLDRLPRYIGRAALAILAVLGGLLTATGVFVLTGIQDSIVDRSVENMASNDKMKEEIVNDVAGQMEDTVEDIQKAQAVAKEVRENADDVSNKIDEALREIRQQSRTIQQKAEQVAVGIERHETTLRASVKPSVAEFEFMVDRLAKEVDLLRQAIQQEI